MGKAMMTICSAVFELTQARYSLGLGPTKTYVLFSPRVLTTTVHHGPWILMKPFQALEPTKRGLWGVLMYSVKIRVNRSCVLIGKTQDLVFLMESTDSYSAAKGIAKAPNPCV